MMYKTLLVLIVIFCGGCGLNKDADDFSEKKIKSSITGLYMSEIIPTDIGQPYRTFLKVSNDSVWTGNFSLNCLSVNNLTNDNYDYKTMINSFYPLSFTVERVKLTFVDNQNVEKKYKSVYKCIHKSEDLLKFNVSNYWFDGILFNYFEEVYYPCD